MQEPNWLQAYLEKVAGCSPEGRAAVEYIRTHRARIGFRRARRSVGAFWTLPGKILLNSFYYDNESVLHNPRAWTLLIHEVRHLEQGWDRPNLRRARSLMQTFAGRGYRADLLPLYPLHKEIRCWLKLGKPV